MAFDEKGQADSKGPESRDLRAGVQNFDARS